MESTMDYLELVVFGTLIGLYYAIARVIAPKICNKVLKAKYTTLPATERISVDIDVVCGVNGLAAFTFAAWILIHHDFSGDYLGTDLFKVRVLLMVQAAYFISDLLLLYHGSGASSSTQYIVHHMACLLAYYVAMVHRVCQFHVLLRTMNEMSTIFFNGRSVLSALKLKDSQIYVMNGMLFMVTFFVSRILTIPLHYYTWVSIPTEDFLRFNPYLSHIFYTLSLMVDILNVYWFSLIFRGFLKYCRKPRSTKERRKEE